MVVTEVWLEVKNGRTTAETARKQHKRWQKKRKTNPTTKCQHGAKKRKRESTTSEQTDSTLAHAGDGAAVRDENDQLFADAQAQLQQEMAAAGFGDDALPLSFGSAHTSSAGSSRKRQRQQHKQPRDISQHDLLHVQPVTAPVAVKKIHVTFDSDGEIADRVVEAVIVPVVATHSIESSEVQNHETEEVGIAETSEEGIVGTTSEVPHVEPAVFKFWKQRRTLFHRYDDGIQLDHESWYSVTPESIAEYIATRCACDVIVDPFSGCGGNIIQFAKICKQVIAIEIDVEKIRMAKANAAIYGVADRIEWIHGDALHILPSLKADVVFLSPPWGGLSYSRTRFGIADMMIGNASGVELFEMARRVAKNVVYYLPKTTPENELQALTPDEAVECEHIYLNGQLKVVNAYYGDLAFAEEHEGPITNEKESVGGAMEKDIEDQSPPMEDATTGTTDVLHVTE